MIMLHNLKMLYLNLLKRYMVVWQFFLWQEKGVVKKYLYPHYKAQKKEEGRQYPQAVIYMVNGWSWAGGLADRLKGMVSLYMWCKDNGKSFKIHFTDPFRLEDYLTENVCKWIIKDEDICYDLNKTDVEAFLMYPLLEVPEVQCKIQELQEQWQNEHLNTAKQQIHVYTNMRCGNHRFCELFNELFKPNARLQKEIDFHHSHLTGKYISISFRFTTLLGDFTDCTGAPLPEAERIKLIQQSLDVVEKIKVSAPAHNMVLVTADSERFLAEVSKLAGVYVIPGKVGHIDYDHGDDVNMKTFLDFFLISGAQKVYLAKGKGMYNSAFAKTAALVNNREFKMYEY